MNRALTTRLMTVSSVIHALAGIASIFAASETAALLGAGSGGAVLVSLWGAALLGFGIMNWTARASILGGVYGRAVVAGNQAHAFIGAMVLLKPALSSAPSWPLLALLAAYGLHALLFSYLMFGARGAEAPSRECP